MSEPRCIPFGATPRELGDVLRSHFDDVPWLVAFTAAAEAADVRRITGQVKDRILGDWRSRFLVMLYLHSVTEGAPTAAHTYSDVAGGWARLQTVVADSVYLFLTDQDGALKFDLQVLGAGSRYVSGIVLGKARESQAFAWV